MEPINFLTKSRVLIIAGKGGVGKTTITAAISHMAAKLNLKSLIIEIEGKTTLPTFFEKDIELSYKDQQLEHSLGSKNTGEVLGRTLTPDEAMMEYLKSHGFGSLSKRFASSGAMEVIATAAPGIKDILILGKIKQLERSNDYDLIIVDAPAAGHALTFLTSASGFLDAIQVGPIKVQASDVAELLKDPTRSQIILVTLPEETPVSETIETSIKMEQEIGMSLGPIIVNGIYNSIDYLDQDPLALAKKANIELSSYEAEKLASAAQFRFQRQLLQKEQVDRITEKINLDLIKLPFLFTPQIGLKELDILSESFIQAILNLESK